MTGKFLLVKYKSSFFILFRRPVNTLCRRHSQYIGIPWSRTFLFKMLFLFDRRFYCKMGFIELELVNITNVFVDLLQFLDLHLL